MIIFGTIGGNISFHYTNNHESGQNILTNVWYQLGLSRSGSVFKLYLDAQEIYSTTLDSNPLEAEGVVIGQEQDSVLGDFIDSQDFDGFVKNFMIFNEALSNENINMIYKTTKPNNNNLVSKTDNIFYLKGEVY